MDSQNSPGSNWDYKPDEDDATSLTPGTDPQLQYVKTGAFEGDGKRVTWTASEFIAHEKSIMWYVVLTIVAVVVAALAYLISRDTITSVVLLLVAIIMGFAAGNKPKLMEYSVDDDGLTIGGKLMPYRNFKSFSIVQDGPFASIMFRPLKRFAPFTAAYIDPKDEDSVIEVVADHLPIEERKSDAVDKLMRHIRF